MNFKRKIILISILFFISVLMLVSSAVFRVKNIEIRLTGVDSTTYFAGQEQELKEASEIKVNSNIFVVNKKKVSEKIEKAKPYAKVNKIVSNFPDKIVIDISKRNEFFYIAESSRFLILDEDMKILKETGAVTSQLLIKLEGINAGGKTAGDFILGTIAEKLVVRLMANQYTLEEIIIVHESAKVESGNLILKTRDNSIYIIENYSTKFNEKINFYASWYNSFSETNLNKTIYETANGEINIKDSI